MTIRRVDTATQNVPPPYAYPFNAGASYLNWDIYVNGFDFWTQGNHELTKAIVRIPNVKDMEGVIVKYPVGGPYNRFHTTVNAYPVSEAGVAYLYELYSVDGICRWKNPDID